MEERAASGSLGAAGVSYLLSAERGNVLFNVGFGSEKVDVLHNADKLGVEPKHINAVAISHLHGDHMGGMRAQIRQARLR